MAMAYASPAAVNNNAVIDSANQNGPIDSNLDGYQRTEKLSRKKRVHCRPDQNKYCDTYTFPSGKTIESCYCFP